jgi:hypothetical protein
MSNQTEGPAALDEQERQSHPLFQFTRGDAPDGYIGIETIGLP